jgi:hypothetical protein
MSSLVEIAGVRAISAEPLVTRWRPVDILCEGDVSVRAKLVRDGEPDTAAVCVSEAVSREVLRVIGLPVAEAHVVAITAEFARDLTGQYGFNPPVARGRHWGTTLLTSTAIEVEFCEDDVGRLREPSQLLTLFVADIVLANPDRRTHGNVLLRKTSDPRKFDLLPIDHSDCFRHPAHLRSAAALTAVRGEKIAEWLPGTELAVLRQQTGAPSAEVARVRALKAQICEAVGNAPDEWYDRAAVAPSSVRDFLEWRLDHLDELVDMSYWEGLENAIGGGHVIDF